MSKSWGSSSGCGGGGQGREGRHVRQQGSNMQQRHGLPAPWRGHLAQRLATSGCKLCRGCSPAQWPAPLSPGAADHRSQSMGNTSPRLTGSGSCARRPTHAHPPRCTPGWLACAAVALPRHVPAGAAVAVTLRSSIQPAMPNGRRRAAQRAHSALLVHTSAPKPRCICLRARPQRLPGGQRQPTAAAAAAAAASCALFSGHRPCSVAAWS